MRNYTNNERELLTFLQSLKISTKSLIDSKFESIEMYEDEKTTPRVPKEVIENVRESIKPLMFRMNWLEAQINEVLKLSQI